MIYGKVVALVRQSTEEELRVLVAFTGPIIAKMTSGVAVAHHQQCSSVMSRANVARSIRPGTSQPALMMSGLALVLLEPRSWEMSKAIVASTSAFIALTTCGDQVALLVLYSLEMLKANAAIVSSNHGGDRCLLIKATFVS